MAGLRSRPRPRRKRVPNSSSMRPVPVPRSTNRSNGPSPSALGDGRLDLGLGDVQGADAVPLGGMGLEVGLRRGLALVLQGLGAAQVAHNQRVGAVDALQHQAGQLAALAGLGQAEIHPAAFRRALDQPRLGQQLEVPADARLALAEDARQVLDVELARRQQHQHAQPRGLGHRLQRSHCCLHGKPHAITPRGWLICARMI